MAWLDAEDLRSFEVHVCSSQELVDWLWRVWVGERTPGQARVVWDALSGEHRGTLPGGL